MKLTHFDRQAAVDSAQQPRRAGAAAAKVKSAKAPAPAPKATKKSGPTGVAAKQAVASAKSVEPPAGRDMVFGVAKPKLTEAQLLKAKEDDYMNSEQLNFFKFKLLEVRSQILANATDTGEHLRENEVTTDPADRATQEEEYTLELRTRDRERKLLKKVERSLRMIDEGTYGWCEESGEPIGIPRLLARPTATLSLEAQERRERMQKLYG
jgi:DnaK suppressor protein